MSPVLLSHNFPSFSVSFSLLWLSFYILFFLLPTPSYHAGWWLWRTAQLSPPSCSEFSRTCQPCWVSAHEISLCVCVRVTSWHFALPQKQTSIWSDTFESQKKTEWGRKIAIPVLGLIVLSLQASIACKDHSCGLAVASRHQGHYSVFVDSCE